VFNSNRSGNLDVVMKDLITGKETVLADTPAFEYRPVPNADGHKVAYSAVENRKIAIYVIASKGGVATRACEDCGGVMSWSGDGKGILYLDNISQPWHVGLVNVASREKHDFLNHPKYNVVVRSISSDGHWMSFHAQLGPLRRQIFIAPLRDGIVPEEKEWIPVTDGLGFDREAFWSPDGNLLYFLSERDGFRCIWAQRLEPNTKASVGEAFSIYHSHSSRRSLMSVTDSGAVGPSVGPDKLVFTQREITGNIWMLEPQK